jgi:hypothetical protein
VAGEPRVKPVGWRPEMWAQHTMAPSHPVTKLKEKSWGQWCQNFLILSESLNFNKINKNKTKMVNYLRERTKKGILSYR